MTSRDHAPDQRRVDDRLARVATQAAFTRRPDATRTPDADREDPDA